VVAALGDGLHACAHITGGGIVGNLPRVLPEDTAALLERASWAEPPIFGEIQRLGAVEEAEMDRVFNRGVGMALVVRADRADDVLDTLVAAGHPSTVIGHVAPRAPGGDGVVIS
jgi:phosphoribosylformylglycinamidine cyclo-ligase